MKEIHYFVAEDGKKFNYESECEEYEFQTLVEPKLANCKAFDSHFNPIRLDADAMLNDHYPSECIYYIYIRDKEGFDTFSRLYHDLGYACPADNLDFKGPMFLHYSDHDDWEDLEAIVQEYQNKIDKMKSAM